MSAPQNRRKPARFLGYKEDRAMYVLPLFMLFTIVCAVLMMTCAG